MQGSGGYSGISIYTPNEKFYIYLEIKTTSFLIVNQEIYEKSFRRWTFLAITYDPETLKAYCAVNQEYSEMSPRATNQSPPNPFKFGGSGKFFLDDILYIPKFSTEEEMSTIFNNSKFLYHSSYHICHLFYPINDDIQGVRKKRNASSCSKTSC